MNRIKWIAVCAALLAPASALADLPGLTLSAGGGLNYPGPGGDTVGPKVAVELSPFYEFTVLRLELPIEYQIHPVTPDLAIRPGVKLFVPVVGFYGRIGVGAQNLISSFTGNGAGVDGVSVVGVLGIGWELDLLDTIGIFFELTGEPQLVVPAGAERGVTGMLRIGAMLNLGD